MNCTTLILYTDKFGRRVVVLLSAIVCSITMLVVGVLDNVPKTPPLQNFLIFVACVWSFFNNSRELFAFPQPPSLLYETDRR